MLLTTLGTNDEVHFYKKSIVMLFDGKRKVLSTSPHNGGYRDDLTAVFNNDATVGAGMAATLMAPTYAEHMALLSAKLGLDPDTSAGISTAAQMENVSIKTASFKDITVTAIVTGGVEVNGGRVGDPASWDELEEKSIEKVKHGTINIILHINADLSEGTMARALVTCTEAKTAALQELVAPSRYSMGLATGSGTDGTIVVANAQSKLQLTNAGKHCKLGELIGITVKEAVTEALYKQTGLCPQSQHNVLKRVDRFGITEDFLWERYCSESDGGLDRARFSDKLHHMTRQNTLVTYSSLYAHLIDQLTWKLISPGEAMEAAQVLLRQMEMPVTADTETDDVMQCVHQMLDALIRGLLIQLDAKETAIPTHPSELGGARPDDSV